MTNSEQVATKYFQAFNNHDVEKGRQMLHPKFSYTGTDGKRMESIQEAVNLDVMFQTAFPDIRLETKNSYTAGDIIINEFMMQGTQKGKFMDIEATNRKINVPLCNILEVRDDKVYSVREYFDTAVMLQQMGMKTEMHVTVISGQ